MLSPDAQADRDYIKEVTRKILGRLEHSLDVVNTEEELELRLKSHDMVFGAKTSLATTLVTLSELLMSLEQTIPAAETADNPAPQILSAGDVALVEAFVRKIKFAAAATPTFKGDLFS